MKVYRRLRSAFAMGCFLLCSLAPHAAAGFAYGREDGSMEIFSAGGRRLQQLITPCPHNWQFDNFTALEAACPYVPNLSENTSYPKKQCCQGLADMLCPYYSLVSDPNSACAKDFWIILAGEAPNYTQNFFQFICTDPNSPQGIPCPNDALNLSGSNATADKKGSLSASLSAQPFWVTLLLAVAVLEALVLLF